jgi:GT2 family glycosyltransferase
MNSNRRAHLDDTPCERFESLPSQGRELVGARPSVSGKFLFVGQEKFYVRGVTYGPFRAEPDGCEYHSPIVVERDFAWMQQLGVNAVRTYTLPPRWLLDLAGQHRLRVLLGLPWEQHVTFLAERRRSRDIEQRVRAGARSCAGHPALLGYTVGNEIPAPIVRWYGHRRVQEYIERLYWAAKTEDPEGLVTYVNYPSTEYLELPFLDFAAFNVYLETPERLQAYLARLQNITGDRPLVMGEVGLDSLRHSEARQAQALDWQARAAFAGGCAGLFFFSWTDEWFRGGHEVEDWKFGLTTAGREPKPALEAVHRVFQSVPFAIRQGERKANTRLEPKPDQQSRSEVERRAPSVVPQMPWPFISVVVCTYNGSRTLRACLEAVQRLEYPAFEVLVVNDGSTDQTAAVAAEFAVHLISMPNGGLSNARNVGWQAAKGELVAYLDDDAAPDPHWLMYLAWMFATTDYAGLAGPNVAWPEDGLIAECVDHAPGNPTHVLVTDREAEHLPGCNMAYRKSCLAAVGGFDPQFRIAGDDVDLCWRLQEHGWKLGFHPAAMVWHHRRGTIRGYWKQQVNYGKAEAMLERKWPEKYNAVGHATWSGRLYSKGFLHWLSWGRRRIYHGTWGSALFQSVYSLSPGTFSSILMLPEWYLIIALLALISACGTLYAPLRYALPLLGLAFVPPLTHAALSGGRAFFRVVPRSHLVRLQRATVTACLHFLQPAARLWGRLGYGLTPWRRRGTDRLVFPRPLAVNLWSESNWRSAEQRLQTFEEALRAAGAAALRGGEFDRWDLEVRGGLLGTARLLMVIEEHGDGRQYVRMRIWPAASPFTLLVACLFALFAIEAALDLEWTAWALLNVPAIFLVARVFYECGSAMAVLKHVIPKATPKQPDNRPSAAPREVSMSNPAVEALK